MESGAVLTPFLAIREEEKAFVRRCVAKGVDSRCT